MRLVLFTNIVCAGASSGNDECKFIKYYEGQTEKRIRICPGQISLMQSDFPDSVRIPISSPLSVQDIAAAINENLAFYLATRGDMLLETRKRPHTVESGKDIVYDPKTKSEKLSTVYKLRTNYMCTNGDLTVARQEYIIYLDQETPSDEEIQTADIHGIQFCNYVSHRFTNLINLVASGAVCGPNSLTSTLSEKSPDCQDIELSQHGTGLKHVMRICPEQIDLYRSIWPYNIIIPMNSGKSVDEIATLIRSDPHRYFQSTLPIVLVTERTRSWSDGGQFMGSYNCRHDAAGGNVLLSWTTCSAPIDHHRGFMNATGNLATTYCNFVASNLGDLIQLLTSRPVESAFSLTKSIHIGIHN